MSGLEIYYNCLRCKDKKVKLMTVDGRQYTGTIVDVDRQYVYLRPEEGGKATTSAFYGGYGYGPYGYGSGVLALSLFTLLAIALI